jgi:DNA primase
MPPPGLSAEARAELSGLMQGAQRQSLLIATLYGLAHYPQQITRHAEALVTIARHHPNLANLIESLIENAETLDSRSPVAIWEEQGHPAPPADSPFAFLRESTEAGDACEELAEAVSLLVERPALEAALAATIARFERDPEGSFAEQARLRSQLAAVNERLKQFGRRKAAMAANEGETPRQAGTD